MRNDLKQIISHSNVDEDDVVVKQQQQWKHSRCLLAAVFITLLATLSVTAVAVTLKLLADSAVKFHVQFTDDSLTAATEDISADVDNNIVEYHMTDPTEHQHLWAISDFNRGVQIFKVVDEAGLDVCYVTPLNDHMTATPTEIINKPPSNGSNLEKVVLHFDAMSAIKDTSVLGSKGQALCASTKSFWIVPHCNSDSETGVTSSKRDDVIIQYVVDHDGDVTSSQRDVRTRRDASSQGRQERQRGRPVTSSPVITLPARTQSMAAFKLIGRYGRN